jgi:hypothetical protein
MFRKSSLKEIDRVTTTIREPLGQSHSKRTGCRHEPAM